MEDNKPSIQQVAIEFLQSIAPLNDSERKKRLLQLKYIDIILYKEVKKQCEKIFNENT